jgi:hypothetical protein
MVNDDFDICRHCGSDACYIFHTGESITWRCMDCGFYTNTFMLKNSEVVKYLNDTSPELFKDISYEDEEGFIWWPMVINKPNVCMISPIGTSKENWSWGFIPYVPIPEDETYKYPIKEEPGKFHSHRSDIKTTQYFEKLDFILALQAANLLNEFTS